MREARRADGATIDPGGSDGDEESAVKARIATAPRPIKDVPRQTRNCFHKYESSRMSRMLLAIFGCSTAHRQVELLGALFGNRTVRRTHQMATRPQRTNSITIVL